MASEQTPLIGQEQSMECNSQQTAEHVAIKATPLPKLQLFSVVYIQFGEPITATVIYPFIVQLVRDTEITGGNEAKTGYYAGYIVSDPSISKLYSG
jgi:hypothetical protein